MIRPIGPGTFRRKADRVIGWITPRTSVIRLSLPLWFNWTLSSLPGFTSCRILDLFQWGGADSHDDCERQPGQDDEPRKSMERPRYERLCGVFVDHLFVAHADFRRQK